MNCAKCIAVCVCCVSGPVTRDDFPFASAINIINCKHIQMLFKHINGCNEWSPDPEGNGRQLHHNSCLL